jgi:dynein heavy chain 1
MQKDIQALKNKFLKKYSNTDAAKISQVRDIPSVSGSAIWAKQLNRRLRVYMERVESILGPDWYEQPESRELKEIGTHFENHLNVQKFCDAYIEEIKSGTTELQPREKIFNIVQKKRSNQLELVVNFDERIINLFKEVRNLYWLKTKLPYTITFKAEEAQGLYPYAVSLQESLRTFNLVNSKIDDRIAKLVATYRREVQATIEAGIQLNWNLKVQLENYVKKLADKVNVFEEAVNNLNEKVEQIYAILASMNNCGLESGVLLEKLESVQKIIDDLNFNQYSNLHQWVPELDVKIEAVLSKRLVEVIANWVKEFESGKPENKALIIETLVHEVKIQDQTIYVDPSIEYSRYFWMQQFHKQVNDLLCC